MLISLLILVIVAIVAYWLITKFIAMKLAKTICLIVAGIVLLIWLLQIVGVVLPSKLI